MAMVSSQGPTSLSAPEIFYRRIVLDMMMASQHSRDTTPHISSPIVKADTGDNVQETYGQLGASIQRYEEKSCWRPCCNLEAATENPDLRVGRIGSRYQLPQTKHQSNSHFLFDDSEVRAYQLSTTQQGNGNNHGLDEAVDCLASSGLPCWPSERHDDVTNRPQESIIDQKPIIGHGLDAGRFQANLPCSTPPHPTRLVKEETSFLDINTPTQQYPTTDDTATAFPPFGMAYSFERISKNSVRETEQIQDFGCDWAAGSSMDILDSGLPAANTIMQRTTALKNIEGSWWGDGSHLLESHSWTDDMNDSLSDLLMARRGPSIDSAENGERFPSPHDSQCSPVSSFASNGFTPDNITFAPQELERSRIDDRNFPAELLRPDDSQTSTILSFDQMLDRYIQLDGPATMTLQTDERSRGSQRKTRGKLGTQRSNAKDAFLVKSKRAGMSYKEIKEKGHFVEAESTLRGRFRNLTKRKEHRVRKPEWKTKDVSFASLGLRLLVLANCMIV